MIVEQNNYLTPCKLISGRNIYEYDIRQANINMLYSYGKISRELYNQLQNSPKEYREVTIGKMISIYDDFYSTISKGIIKSKKLLVEGNRIREENIVRIANDAVYVMSPYPLSRTKFHLTDKIEIEFVCKNHFTSFLQLFNVSIFMETLDDENLRIDTKGLGKYADFHEKFLSFLSEILFYEERSMHDITLKSYREFYQAYINLELDVCYYREFNSNSIFHLKTRSGSTSRVLALQPLLVDDIKVDQLDIGFNYNVLRELYSILVSR